MRVVTYNIHAGVDGYGRGNDVVDHAVSLAPDLLFAQEVWRGEREDQFNELLTRLDLSGEYVALGTGDRVTGEAGGRGWQSPLALIRGEEGLYFDERRDLTSHQQATRPQAKGRESGEWGMAVLTNREVLSLSVEHLPQLHRDKVRRALIVARMRDEGRDFTAVGLHGAHLTHGSLLQYRHVARRLDELSQNGPLVVGGDFNCWRPLLRTVLRGYDSGVRARTWPAWRAHSQIDHLLLRGNWVVSSRSAARGPSDHKALILVAKPA